MKNEYPHWRFVPRRKKLLALEGTYNGITLSCRHKDILRCSMTRHFKSCFAPGGIYEEQPYLYCMNPNVAICYVRDRSGVFEKRCFVFYGGRYEQGKTILHASECYGNGLDYVSLSEALSPVACVIKAWNSTVYL